MEHRQEKRFSSYAKVILLEQDKFGYLRDLNHSGCQIDFLESPSLKMEDQIEIRIIPNEELNLPVIEQMLKVQWMRQDNDLFFSIGGSLSRITEENKEAFNRLLSHFVD